MSLINSIYNQVKGLPRAPQPAIPAREIWITLIATIIGLGVTGALAYKWSCPMLAGPFGSTATIIYGAYKAPLAQPRNVLLGHFLSALTGVAVYDFFGTTWWSIALGVAIATIFMAATYSMHPPAGATAYVAVLTGGLGQGYSFILNPIMIGVFILTLVAVLVSKAAKRDYPTHWW
ncbi:MAG: HPP family protein [Candidatus Scalindua sp.]|nr:HPP family protein [Candidatus Scalindua sp.]